MTIGKGLAMTRGKGLAMTLPLVVARHNSAEAISVMGKRLPRFARNDKEEIVCNDKRK
jgi:hypothetical protein